MKILTTLTLATAIAVCGFAGASFAADKADREKAWEQEWKTEAAERKDKDNKYGKNCMDRFTARGTGRVGLGITQLWAKLRTERHWQDEATKLYGAEYASWSKAKGKEIACEVKDKMLLCKATANACKA